ncbi:MAG: hypothetical protein HY265_03775 [Deltaproteobacteria bacterium]|nr:hypothetical protein [Deltaproteobacteria bacterium]
MTKRILLLGTTGVEKSDAVKNLVKFAETQIGFGKLELVDFEKEYILRKNNIEIHSYLDAEKYRQRDYWLEGWKQFKTWHKKNKDKDVLLSLHGVLTRSINWKGIRSPVDINCFIDFAPNIIITLIDDVYLKWFRTTDRSKGSLYKGKPTLEQLLDARRAEIFLGDLIANHITSQPKHYVVAVQHPARILYRLLFGDGKVKSIYLSFPISGPRRLLEKNNRSGIKEINAFLEIANDFENRTPQAVCFCPLTIDEFPLLSAMEKQKDKSGQIIFKMQNRWNVREFWDKEELLTNEKAFPKTITLPKDEIEKVKGLIEADVGARDYRLVLQSTRLAVYNPWFKNKETGGVRNEIQLACANEIPVLIYQYPKHDTNAQARKTLKPKPGSLGYPPGSDYITFYDSPQEIFENII